MKLEKINNFSDDKKIEIIGFRQDDIFILENRSLWCEIILRNIHCKECEDQDQITFHIKDIPKLIKGLNKLMKLQDIKHKKWEKLKD